ncbi:MAG: S8 family serine peptidase [Rubrivivax sp.]|nr:S8 family serine peptidase [Rubrivivax sp.]
MNRLVLRAAALPIALWLGAATASASPVDGFIVRWHDPAAAADAATARGERWQRIALGAPVDRATARRIAAGLRADPRIADVVPNLREQPLAVTPSDPRFAEQWWLAPRGAPLAAGPSDTGLAGFARAWQRSTGAAAPVAVAVLDSGITSHPETNARLLPGYDFVADARYAADGDGRDADAADPGDAVTALDRSSDPDVFLDCPPAPRSTWHGTTIAGQLAAVTDNGQGVAAAHWGGLVVPVRVAGKCGAAIGDIVDGLRWAAGLAVPGVPANPNPARVIVLGYGSPDPCDAASADPDIAAAARLYRDTIAEVRAAGSVVVVAAGNRGEAVGRPASCTGAFAVTALNREGYKAAYASFGSQIDLATPGGDADTGGTCDAQLADGGLVSTGNFGDTTPGAAGYVAASGTSFAAPAVAAAAALMLSVNPALTVAQIEGGLKRSARPHVQVPLLGACSLADNRGRCACTTTTCGAGMLDVDQALRYAASPAAYVAPQRSAATLDDARIRACAVILGRPLPPDPEPEPEPEPPVASGGGGGGAASPWWIALLALASFVLHRRRAAA